MVRLINVVVTSTKRKRSRILPPFEFRTLSKVSFTQRHQKWISRLEGGEAPRVEAGELYAGDHWQIARDLPRHAAAFGWDAKLWICSPGYGLIRPCALIHPYSANYSSRHIDSILAGCKLDRISSLQHWWREMAAWPGPEPGQPRTLEELGRQFPDVPLLVIASEAILKVIEPDLLEASRQLRRSTDLLIVSGGTSSAESLGSHLLPCDARLQNILGGARMSLNVRTARFLLENCPTKDVATTWSAQLAGLLKNAPPVKRYERTALTDDEVADFVLRGFHANHSTTWSRLLRQLRDEGYCCEQKRFAAIFNRVAAEIGLE